MKSELTPVQRLAISRAKLADSVRDPVWLIFLQRWLHTKAKTAGQTAHSEKHSQR
jgi:hypothetical protein